MDTILSYLVNQHHCHTVILYGSRANNDHELNSDCDIFAVRESGDFEKDCCVLGSTYLDAFIYPEDKIQEPDSFFIRIKDGKVLLQKNNLGDELLKQANSIYDKGPSKTPTWEKQEIKCWLLKMLGRTTRNDIEGNFRKVWLLTELLSCYFRLRDSWYLGPKKSFSWLKIHDSEVYNHFERCLSNAANFYDLEVLINTIVAI